MQHISGCVHNLVNTPDKVIQSLPHLEIGISSAAINTTIKSRSHEAEDEICTLGHTLLTSYAYDNFDVQLKSQLPSLEKCSETLAHMTSAMLLRLEHGVTTNDLRCSRLLWECSTLNDSACWSMPSPSFENLCNIHPESEHLSGLSRREQSNSWKLRYDIFYHGPKYFHQFRHTGGG
ncbi:hypothetical protein JAAARDRAFT_160894 [Jaapia argillacea MUCL 33604]|uniref:Uncharacterized protein n=1 Tax=Jaapia argillacea MUCL 33604 TaxID=933084 RepID=A0A067PHT9_9AGAM|nr:hypothetical protein JAAARDRAFT_160894 [Jaapia argillacea MUCL 33604]